MKNVILIAESNINNGHGYMDLTAETIQDELVISTENHDGYEWKAKCSLEMSFHRLVEAIGTEKATELLNKYNSI